VGSRATKTGWSQSKEKLPRWRQPRQRETAALVAAHGKEKLLRWRQLRAKRNSCAGSSSRQRETAALMAAQGKEKQLRWWQGTSKPARKTFQQQVCLGIVQHLQAEAFGESQ
jgi:hypothetical protein